MHFSSRDTLSLSRLYRYIAQANNRTILFCISSLHHFYSFQFAIISYLNVLVFRYLFACILMKRRKFSCIISEMGCIAEHVQLSENRESSENTVKGRKSRE